MPAKKSSRPAQPATKDAIALLKEEHKMLREMLGKLEGSASRASKARDTLFDKVEQEIRVHNEVEEQIFYPVFKEVFRKKNDQQFYFAALEEHHAMDLVTDELAQKPEPEVFTAKCKVLITLADYHIRQEERDRFTMAKKGMKKEQLTQLGEQIQQRKPEIRDEIMSSARSGG